MSGRTTLESAAIPVTGLVLRRLPAGREVGWHHAPECRFLITLAGACEIVASDGESRWFGPGTILHLDDPTGKGHIARVSPSEDWLTAILPTTGA